MWDLMEKLAISRAWWCVECKRSEVGGYIAFKKIFLANLAYNLYRGAIAVAERN